MELIAIVAIGAILWVVFSGSFKTNIQDPQRLRPAEIEESIVELKKKILVTSAHTAEAEYARLYRRLNVLMGQIHERHAHFGLDQEAKGAPGYGFFLPRENRDADGMPYTTYVVPYDLDPSCYDPDLLIYACFFLWHGGHAKNFGIVESNPELMSTILDYLIKERNFGPAIFLKGMVLKYGLKVYSQCFPNEAKELLLKAQRAGVGSAALELEHIGKFSQLEGVKSVQLGE